MGRTAVVTGAARGIGTAIAEGLAAAGHDVAVLDLDADAAGKVASGLTERHGVRAIGVGVDITDAAGVGAAVARVTETLGPVEVLVNNAGVDVIKPFLDSTEEEWARIVAVNLLGTIRMTRAVLDPMVERGWGRVVMIASDAGRVGSSGEVVYSGSKGGVIAFGKALAREVARHGVTVNSVCPGPPTPRCSTRSPPSARSSTKAWPRRSRCAGSPPPRTSRRRSPSSRRTAPAT